MEGKKEIIVFVNYKKIKDREIKYVTQQVKNPLRDNSLLCERQEKIIAIV